MTRFARIHRNKSSFAKIPEEPTPWAEFKQQLNNKTESKHNTPDEQSKISKEENSKIVNNIESSWCDFEENDANKSNSSFEANRSNHKPIKNKRHLNVKNGNLVKKHLQRNIVDSSEVDDSEVDSTIKRRNKLKYNMSLASSKLDEIEESSNAKKRKHDHNVDGNRLGDVVDSSRRNEIEETGHAKKKKKKHDHNVDDSKLEVHDSNRNDEIEESGHSKKKKRKHEHNIDGSKLVVQDTNRNDEIEESGHAKKKKKKHDHNIDGSKLEVQDNNRNDEIEESGHTKKKKKKHDHNIDGSKFEVQVSNRNDEIEESGQAKKKKKKHDHNIDGNKLEVQDSNRNDEIEESGHAKKKKKKHVPNINSSMVEEVQDNSRNDEVKETGAAKKKQKKLKFSIAEDDKVEYVGDNCSEGNFMMNKNVRKNKQNCSEISTNGRSNVEGKNERKKNQDTDKTCVVDGENVTLTKFDGFYILKPDAEKFEKIRRNLLSEGRPKQEIDGVVRRHRRNAEKILSKKLKKLCFNCREGVHNLAECPKLGHGGKQAPTGVCYKCGSTEHTLYQCKQPGNELKFAKCFICNENGHLSKQCPDNPRGLYPLGGSCRICGDVTHLKRDCPELSNRRRDNTITIGTIGENTIDCLDEDSKPKSRSEPFISKKPLNKIIKFH